MTASDIAEIQRRCTENAAIAKKRAARIGKDAAAGRS